MSDPADTSSNAEDRRIDPRETGDRRRRLFSVADSRESFPLLSASVAIRDLVRWGDERLLAANDDVFEADGLERLIADLVETCHAAPGVGLAAPQIGVNRRVAIVDLSVGEDPSAVIVLVNPVVVSAVGGQKEEEGCLSVPDVAEKVVRPASVVVRAADAELRVREIEGTGLLARALCHETDHLNGMLFVDRLRGLKKEMTWRKIERRRARGSW
jgi:peptide deformylase